MQHLQTSQRSTYELFQLMDEYPDSVDPDFDAGYEALAHEFAVLRLTCANH